MNARLRDRIDLLVDDELTAEERAELLRELARHPDGWRVCAEAFVEAQSLRRALEPAPALRRPRRRRWGSPMAAAASLALAFLLGAGWPRPAVVVERQVGPGMAQERPTPETAAVVPTPAPFVPNAFLIARVEDGLVTYSTPRDLPDFVLESLSLAGHRVELIPRSVELPLADGSIAELPFVETKITPRENFHL